MGSPSMKIHWFYQIYPLGRFPRLFPNTKEEFKKDYEAACRTLSVSPEASACMSRRCLQSLLRSRGYVQRELAGQIEAVLAEHDPDKMLPKSLRQIVDAVRGYGNFAAHAQNSKTTLEIIPIEPGEAEWCIEIIEHLLFFYFEEPAAAEEKLGKANKKFGDGGRPTLKK